MKKRECIHLGKSGCLLAAAGKIDAAQQTPTKWSRICGLDPMLKSIFSGDPWNTFNGYNIPTFKGRIQVSNPHQLSSA